MDHGGGSGNGEKGADRRYSLKLELNVLREGRLGVERKKGALELTVHLSPWSKCGRCRHQEVPVYHFRSFSNINGKLAGSSE